MGDLIVMTRPNRSASGFTASAAGAEILFFTGVRYFRMPEEPIPAPREIQAPREKKRPRLLKNKKTTTIRRAKLNR